jgi:hypothetical protein
MRISRVTIGSAWLRSLIAVTVVVAGGSVVAVAPANAKPAQPLCAPARSKALESGDLSMAVANMRIAGKTKEQIDESLAKEFGLQLMTKPEAETIVEDDAIEAVSTGNDVTVNTPSIYRDACSTTWYVYASYRWNTMSRFRSELPLFCGDPCALSGTDGFGISLSRQPPVLGGASMTTWGTTSKFPATSGRTWIDTSGALGYWFEGVDHFSGGCCPDDYSFYNGEIFMGITSMGCGPLQAFSRYSHTWSNVEITGVSFAPLSLGLSWSSSSNRWGKGSNNSSAVSIC